MKNTVVLGIAFAILSGCTTIENTWKGLAGASVERTFSAPVARVKPAFISTLSQMGMPIAAMELRGKSEVVKARKADKSVEVEIERLGANSTRVRVTGSDDATANQVMKETEKHLPAG